MPLITRHDHDTVAGQTKIVAAIHKLEVRVKELEMEVHKLQQKEEMVEHEFQGPEAY
jgi:cell division protein FtsB